MSRIELPDVDDVTLAFPASIPDFERLREAAVERGFRKNWLSDKSCDAAALLFYEGGLMFPREGVTEEEFNRARRYLRTVLGSFAPTHEDKIAVAGLVIHDWIEVKKAES